MGRQDLAGINHDAVLNGRLVLPDTRRLLVSRMFTKLEDSTAFTHFMIMYDLRKWRTHKALSFVALCKLAVCLLIFHDVVNECWCTLWLWDSDAKHGGPCQRGCH